MNALSNVLSLLRLDAEDDKEEIATLTVGTAKDERPGIKSGLDSREYNFLSSESSLMREEEGKGKEHPGLSQPRFIEVLCKSSGKIRRFASGTDAGFALYLINSKLGSGVPPALYIEASKEREEPVSFGPKAALVYYGEGWKLQTAIEEGLEATAQSQQISKQFFSLVKPADRRSIRKSATGSNTTTFQYIAKLIIAFSLMFLLGGILTIFLENLPWLIQFVTSS